MIRDGALAEPVREVTIASTLQRLLLDIDAVGGDLEWLPGGTGSVHPGHRRRLPRRHLSARRRRPVAVERPRAPRRASTRVPSATASGDRRRVVVGRPARVTGRRRRRRRRRPSSPTTAASGASAPPGRRGRRRPSTVDPVAAASSRVRRRSATRDGPTCRPACSRRPTPVRARRGASRPPSEDLAARRIGGDRPPARRRRRRRPRHRARTADGPALPAHDRRRAEHVRRRRGRGRATATTAVRPQRRPWSACLVDARRSRRRRRARPGRGRPASARACGATRRHHGRSRRQQAHGARGRPRREPGGRHDASPTRGGRRRRGKAAHAYAAPRPSPPRRTAGSADARRRLRSSARPELEGARAVASVDGLALLQAPEPPGDGVGLDRRARSSARHGRVGLGRAGAAPCRRLCIGGAATWVTGLGAAAEPLVAASSW